MSVKGKDILIPLNRPRPRGRRGGGQGAALGAFQLPNGARGVDMGGAGPV